jgi:hypothetical protein
MSQYCVRCKHSGGLDESYVNVNATSVFIHASSLSLMRDKDASMSHADVSSHVKKIQRLHVVSEGVMSSQSLSQPFCTECIQILNTMLDNCNENTRHEKRSLTSFLSLSSVPKSKPSDVSLEFVNKTKKYRELTHSMKKEQLRIQREIELIKSEVKRIELEEQELWETLDNRMWEAAKRNETRDMLLGTVSNVTLLFLIILNSKSR